MNLALEKSRHAPTLVRVVPFAIFLLLTFFQNHLGEAARYWLYLAKTVVGAWMIWQVWRLVPEMRWKVSGAAIVVGLVVFIMWISIDQLFREWGLPFAPRFKISQGPWNPNVQFGAGSLLAWFFIVVRIAGVSIVVPPLEEVFFRSWLYRYLSNPQFEAIPLGQFRLVPFLVTSIVFGMEHQEWLAGILCGFAFQALVCWKKRLSDAITAHTITNFLLGIWVVWKGAWLFW